MSRIKASLLTKCKKSQETVLHEVRFQNYSIFGNMVFGDIGKLNVITGPNGVGKSRLLNEMSKLIKLKLHQQNIYPVHLRFNADSVKATVNNDTSPFDHLNWKLQFNRNVYNGEDETTQNELQIIYELGMKHNHIENEYSIVKYLWVHKLIKFGATDTDTDDMAIDINSHLKDLKYEISPTLPENEQSKLIYSASRASYIKSLEKPFQFKKKGDNSNSLVDLNLLSSGERTYFFLLLWDIIAKLNKILIDKKLILRKYFKILF